MSKRRRVQVVLTLMDGAEPWVRVTHQSGWFKVPADTTIHEVLAGALAGWTYSPRKLRHGEPYVRVPISVYLNLEDQAASWRSTQPGGSGGAETQPSG